MEDANVSGEDLLRLHLTKQLVKETLPNEKPVFLRSFVGQRGCVFAAKWTSKKSGIMRTAFAVIVAAWIDDASSLTITKVFGDVKYAEMYAEALAAFGQCQEVQDE